MTMTYSAAARAVGAALLVTLVAGLGIHAVARAQQSVATVNGEALDANVYEAYLRSASQQTQAELTEQQKNQLLEQLINLELAAREAEKEGLDKRKDVSGQLELMRLNVLADASFDRYLESNPVTDAEVKAEYDTQIAAMPREYRAKHILVETEAQAKSVIDRLGQGESFADLAKSESKDQSAGNGGDLGWFTPQTMVKPFADAVTSLEKGTYTKSPVESQFGWHVIQLDDVRKPEAPPIEQVRDQIVGLVQRKKIQRHIADLRENASIQKTD